MPTTQELINMGFGGYAGWGDAEANADYNATGGSGKGSPTATPGTTSPQATPQASSGGQPGSAQDLINMGFYGYQGWGNAEAIADYKATGGSGKGSATSGNSSGNNTDFSSLLSSTASQPFDLTGIYNNLFSSSGITDKESGLVNSEKQYLEAKSKISDNPFLSASMVDQRLQRLDRKYKTETDPIRSQIAMKKADIEMQLNLQMKQFDINSQMARDNLSKFNAIFEMGGLDNATGEDIANFTRMTGIPSSVIQSAIQARKDANKKDIKTQIVTSTSDSGEVTVSTINSDTGVIINQTSLGNVGNAQTGSGGTSTSEQKMIDENTNRQNAVAEIKAGYTLRQIIDNYGVSGGLSIEEIYRLYNSNSPWGQATESLEDVKEGIYNDEEERLRRQK